MARGELRRARRFTVCISPPPTRTPPGVVRSPKPVVVAKWTGSDSSAPALLLNSHYDVVPTMAEHWTKPTFAGHIEDVDGETRIYGRGTQDMKLVCIQYLVAVFWTMA